MSLAASMDSYLDNHKLIHWQTWIWISRKYRKFSLYNVKWCLKDQIILLRKHLIFNGKNNWNTIKARNLQSMNWELIFMIQWFSDCLYSRIIIGLYSTITVIIRPHFRLHFVSLYLPKSGQFIWKTLFQPWLWVITSVIPSKFSAAD